MHYVDICLVHLVWVALRSNETNCHALLLPPAHAVTMQ
jgi:hypothetical protein